MPSLNVNILSGPVRARRGDGGGHVGAAVPPGGGVRRQTGRELGRCRPDAGPKVLRDARGAEGGRGAGMVLPSNLPHNQALSF